MFVLKDTGSVYFDEAYFVLKSNPPSKSLLSEKEFLDEANRIITEYGSEKSPLLGKGGGKTRGSFLFGLAFGVVFGIALCVGASLAGVL